MECIISGCNMKVVNKALLALSKISDEIYIECKPDHLSLVAINQTTSAYGKYNFRSIFFTIYEVEGDTQESTDSKVACKLYMKSLLNVFKMRMDKKIELCKIKLEQNATQIIFKLTYKHDVTIIHKLKLINSDYLTLQYKFNDANNNISGSGHFFTQILSNIQMGDNTLSMEVTNSKIILKNYNIDVEDIYSGMRTQLSLNCNEFLNYSVSDETVIIFATKPFRSLISFAEHFTLDLNLRFKGGASPMQMTVKSATFDIEYILSTLTSENASQTSTTTGASSEPIFKIQNRQHSNPLNTEQHSNTLNGEQNITVQDQEAMDTENWDDDFINDLENGKRVRGSFGNVLKDLDNDVIEKSPEIKKAKIFGRCFDPTFHSSMLDFGESLAANSDSD